MFSNLSATKTLWASLAMLALAACSDEASTGTYVGYVEGEYVYVCLLYTSDAADD